MPCAIVVFRGNIKEKNKREDLGFERSLSTMRRHRYNTRSSLSSRNGEDKISEKLPFDLVVEILMRLPAKSVAKFRCLSKQYGSIICTPNFTDTFFKISSSWPKLLFTCLKSGKTSFFSSPHPQNMTSPVTAKLHMSFRINCPSEVSRPLHGLVCGLIQHKIKGRIVTVPLICNPSTGESLTLPRVKTRRKRVINYLGYDPINKQFKLLCMTKSYVGPSFSEEHQVLTLETGKEPGWKRIKCNIPHSPVNVGYVDRQCVYDGICINGVLYYLAWHVGFPDIVCFDIRSEKFDLIKGDHGMRLNPGGKLESNLVNYKGGLAKLQPNINVGLYTGIHLWVLENAQEHRWSSYIYVLPHPWSDIIAETKLCFVGTTSTGEIVLSPNNISDSFYLLYCNPETNTINRVEIQGMEAFKPHKVFTFLDHVEDVKLMQSV